MTKTAIGTILCTVGLAAAMTLVSPNTAHAQGFVSPLIGYDFGGDSGCPSTGECEDRKVNAGVAFGTLGPLLGLEVELAYANSFFGEGPEHSSSVLTVMANAIVGPQIGPVRPYGTGGIGLMKTRIDLTPESLVTTGNNHLGWNVGAGLMLFAGKHVGVRGEIRRFHAFQELEVPWLALNGTTLNFNRASAALLLRF